MSVRLASACALVLLSGCGGKQQPAKPPAAPAVDPAPAAEEPPDLSAVARPAEVVAIARVARPRLLVETLGKWSSVPLDPSDLVPSEARALSPVLLWDAPIEVVAALDPFGEGNLPRTLEVAAVGLKSLPEALSAADRMQLVTRRLAPGVWRVGELSEGSCALAASVGPAPARLVCGKSSKDVDALLPYATRGLPREPQSGADLEITLEAAPIQERYGTRVGALRLFAGAAMREVALDSPRFDRAVSDLIYGGIDEAIALFGDLQQVRLEARLDAARNVLTASAELRLKGDTSWLAGTLAASKPVAVPTTLPRLPPGTSSAWFSASMPAERFVALDRVISDLAEGYLEHEKLPEASRKRVRKALEPWLQKMPETFAFTLPPRPAPGTTGPLHETTISRVSEPSATVLASYGNLLSLLEDRPFKRWVQEKAQLSDKAWPKLTKKPFKLPGFKTPATVFEVTTDPKSWSSSSSIARSMVEKWLPLTQGDGLVRFLLVIQPDGPATYVCTGETTAEVAHAMAEHRKSEPGAFFARPSRSGPVGSAGFFTIAGIARALERSDNARREARLALAAAPNRGETPIPFSTASGPGSARFDLELPAAALADLVAIAMSIDGGSELRGPVQQLR